jgi:hypothetical protein
MVCLLLRCIHMLIFFENLESLYMIIAEPHVLYIYDFIWLYIRCQCLPYQLRNVIRREVVYYK